MQLCCKSEEIGIYRNTRTYYIQKSGCAALLRVLRIRLGFFSTYHKIAAADRILLKIIDK